MSTGLCVKAPSLTDAEQASSDTRCGGDDIFHYRMNSKTRGLFVIFNHKDFDHVRSREGTDVDEKTLTEVFRDLDFKVESHKDSTKKELLKKVDHYAYATDHSEYNCFACAVLTHGGKDDILYAKDGEYHIRNIMDPFRHCRSLDGKPKLFFIQACRGKSVDPGKRISVESDAVDIPELVKEEQHITTIPIESNFLIAYSTTEGYYSYRHPEEGTWFIQSLGHCFREYVNMELLQILTMANRYVCHNRESTTEKQAPSIVTRLTGLVYFNRRPHSVGAFDVHKSLISVSSEVFDSQSKDDETVEELKERILKLKLAHETQIGALKTKLAERKLQEFQLRKKSIVDENA